MEGGCHGTETIGQSLFYQQQMQQNVWVKT